MMDPPPGNSAGGRTSSDDRYGYGDTFQLVTECMENFRLNDYYRPPESGNEAYYQITGSNGNQMVDFRSPSSQYMFPLPFHAPQTGDFPDQQTCNMMQNCQVEPQQSIHEVTGPTYSQSLLRPPYIVTPLQSSWNPTTAAPYHPQNLNTMFRPVFAPPQLFQPIHQPPQSNVADPEGEGEVHKPYNFQQFYELPFPNMQGPFSLYPPVVMVPTEHYGQWWMQTMNQTPYPVGNYCGCEQVTSWRGQITETTALAHFDVPAATWAPPQTLPQQPEENVTRDVTGDYQPLQLQNEKPFSPKKKLNAYQRTRRSAKRDLGTLIRRPILDQQPLIANTPEPMETNQLPNVSRSGGSTSPQVQTAMPAPKPIKPAEVSSSIPKRPKTPRFGLESPEPQPQSPKPLEEIPGVPAGSPKSPGGTPKLPKETSKPQLASFRFRPITPFKMNVTLPSLPASPRQNVKKEDKVVSISHDPEKSYCKLCRSNKETPSFYQSHVLQDADGIIRCPVLRALVCPKCGATGDNAHTIRYCPLFKRSGSASAMKKDKKPRKRDDDDENGGGDRGHIAMRTAEGVNLYQTTRTAAGGYSYSKF